MGGGRGQRRQIEERGRGSWRKAIVEGSEVRDLGEGASERIRERDLQEGAGGGIMLFLLLLRLRDVGEGLLKLIAALIQLLQLLLQCTLRDLSCLPTTCDAPRSVSH